MVDHDRGGVQVVALTDVISGLAIGLTFGYALQRGQFCFNTAFKNALTLKDYSIVKSIGVAMTVEMVGFQLVSDLGLVQLHPRGFYPEANILGGFMFGIGMAIASGCMMGITYRSGEGMVGAILAMGGVALGAGITLSNSTSSLRSVLQNMSEIQPVEHSLTIPGLLGVSPWLMIVPLFALALFFARRSYRKEKREGSQHCMTERRWSWGRTGVVVGLIGVLSYPAAEMAGRSSPLALTGGYAGILGSVVYQDIGLMGWDQVLTIGAVLGGFGAALLAKQLRIQIPNKTILGQSLLGGLIMGVGAVLGDGCNITTILIGVPLFSFGSILAGAFTILGCCTAIYLTSKRSIRRPKSVVVGVLLNCIEK